MRKNLKKFRIDMELTQKELAEKLGCTTQNISLIEQGRRQGTAEFWRKFQKTFNLSGEKVWELMNNE